MFLQVGEDIFKAEQIKSILVYDEYDIKKLEIYMIDSKTKFVTLDLSKEIYEQYKTAIAEFIPCINSEIKMLRGCLERSARDTNRLVDKKKVLEGKIKNKDSIIAELEFALSTHKEEIERLTAPRIN